MNKKDLGIKVVATNKRARFDYELLDLYEAGLVLTGTEVKSVRASRANLQRSYVQQRDGELWLVEAHISPYEHGHHDNHEPTRPRKLLLHRRQINQIVEALTQKGLTVVPTRLYLKDSLVKLEVALARGKAKYDKRASLAKRDAERQVERALRQKYR